MLARLAAARPVASFGHESESETGLFLDAGLGHESESERTRENETEASRLEVAIRYPPARRWLS